MPKEEIKNEELKEESYINFDTSVLDTYLKLIGESTCYHKLIHELRKKATNIDAQIKILEELISMSPMKVFNEVIEEHEKRGKSIAENILDELEEIKMDTYK